MDHNRVVIVSPTDILISQGGAINGLLRAYLRSARRRSNLRSSALNRIFAQSSQCLAKVDALVGHPLCHSIY